MRSKDYELRTLGARISFLLRCCQRIWHRAHDVRLEVQPKLMWIQIWCRHHISTWLISNHWQFSANKDHMQCLQSCLVATFQRYSSLVEIVSRVWHASSVCALVSLVREGHQHLHLGPHLPRVVSAEPRKSHKQARTGPPVHSYVHKFICAASSKFAISY